MGAKLTVNAIDRAIPRAQPYEIHDTKQPGLLLRIQPSGVKSFIVQWGRGKRVTLKPRYPSLTLENARSQARATLAEADHGAPSNWKPKNKADTVRTFGQFLEHRYPTMIADKKAKDATLANIKAQFGDLTNKPLTAITAWDIDKFKAARTKAGIKPATINRDLDRIRAALNAAIKSELLKTNPLDDVKRFKVDNKRVRYLSVDEEKRLRKALSDRESEHRKERKSVNARLKLRRLQPRPIWSATEYTDHLMPLVLLAINTGLRRGELLALTWECVDLDRRQLTVAAHTAKSGKVRYAPLNAEALDVTTRWKSQGTGTGPVFTGTKGEQLTHTKRSWDGVLKAAGLVDFRFHDLRHHFASRLVMANVDLYVVKELLGHADYETTARYAHLSPQHRLAAVEKLTAR